MTTEKYQEIVIQSDFDQVAESEKAILSQAESLGYSQDDIFALRLSLEEALANCVRHGNQGQKDKKISLRYYINEHQADIYIADEGCGFNPQNVPDPTTVDHLEIPNGRGIMLMRAYMNLVEYNQRGNVVHMIKLRQGGKNE